MMAKLLTEHHLEYLSLKAGCRGSSEPTLVKCQIVENLMPRLSPNRKSTSFRTPMAPAFI